MDNAGPGDPEQIPARCDLRVGRPHDFAQLAARPIARDRAADFLAANKGAARWPSGQPMCRDQHDRPRDTDPLYGMARRSVNLIYEGARRVLSFVFFIVRFYGGIRIAALPGSTSRRLCGITRKVQRRRSE